MEKFRHNCNEYVISYYVSIWEIKENSEEYSYYFKYRGQPLDFAFGTTDGERFTGEDLNRLYENGYFDSWIEEYK